MERADVSQSERPGTRGKGGKEKPSGTEPRPNRLSKKKNTIGIAQVDEEAKSAAGRERGLRWRPLLVGGDNLYRLDESCVGRTWEHDQIIVAEVTKLLWLSLEPVQKELDTSYILKHEFQQLGQCLVAVVKNVPLEEAQREVDQHFKEVIPSFLLVSQKMDFLMFTEALSNLASRYVPDEVAEGQAMWIAKVGNRIMRKEEKEEEEEEEERVNVFDLMRTWTSKHRSSKQVDYGASIDICKMFDEAAELAHHVGRYSLKAFSEIEADPQFLRYQDDCMFGEEPGYFTRFDREHDDEWRSTTLARWKPGVCIVEEEDGSLSVKPRKGRKRVGPNGELLDDSDESERGEEEAKMLMLKRSKSFRRRPLIKMPSIRPTTAYWVCHFTRKVFQKNQFYSACSPGSPARSERNSSSSSSLGRRRSSRKESVVSRDSSSHFLYLDGKDSLEVDKFSAALSRSSSHNRGHRGSVSSSGPDREQEEEIVSASAQEELLQDYEEAYKQDLHNLFSPTSIDQPKPEADAGEAEESAMKQETPEEEMRKEKMPEEETRRARKGSAPLVRELLRPTRVMFDTSQRESARGCRVTWRVAGTRGEQRRDPLRPRTRSVVMARSMSKKEGESVDDLITLYAQLKKDEEARQRRGLVASGTCKTSEDGGSM